MKDTYTHTFTQAPCVDTEQLRRFGFSFVPVNRRGKMPILPMAQYQHRHPTRAEAAHWREQYPAANYGIVCGRISGVVVLDIDDTEASREWCKAHGGLPLTPYAKTGSGFHLYFRHPEGRAVASAFNRHGCDLLAEGMCATAPGSVHESGARYEWILSPDDVQPAPLPAWIEAPFTRPPTRDDVRRERAEIERSHKAIRTMLAQLSLFAGRR